jgi:hypothetical protein
MPGEVGRERRKNLPNDTPVDVAQYLRDGKSWESFWPSLAKAYAEFGIEIHVHFCAGFVKGDVAGDFCAVFYRTPVHEFDAVGRVVVAGGDKAEQPGRKKDEVRQPVLIHVVKLVEPPKGIGLGEPIPSLVRLQPLDNCLRMFVYAPKHVVEFARILLDLDGKTGVTFDLAGYRATVACDGKFKNEVVKGAAEIMEAVSDDEAKFGRRRVEHFDAHDLLAAIDIGFGPGSVWAIFDPGSDFGFKTLQVVKRPVESSFVMEGHGTRVLPSRRELLQIR